MKEAEVRSPRRLIHRLPDPAATILFVVSVLATWLIPMTLLGQSPIVASVAAIVLFVIYGAFFSPRTGFGPLWLDLIELALLAQTILITIYAIVVLIKSYVGPSA